jgi:sialic acid synthase SpsE
MIKIGDKILAKGGTPFIIAEVGINHNGELQKAFDMIRVAKNAGADAVKFQTFKANEFVNDSQQLFTYSSQGKTVTESMLEMFRRYEFSEEQWARIKTKCDEEKILFMSTPQNVSDLELLMKLGIPAIKVGSDDFTNLPLLKEYKKKNLPIIVSCGMADLGEIYVSLDTLGAFEGYPVILLLCTSEYPTPPEHVNLLKLRTLSAVFPDLLLGFSDHTQGPLASSLAVAFSATVFEKHFTLDKNLPGPDHWFSEDPASLKEWCDSIRKAYQMLGNAQVKPTKAEKEMRILARRSIVVTTDIGKGEILTDKNIALKRPGNGIAPSHWDDVIGRKAKQALRAGTLLNWKEIE